MRTILLLLLACGLASCGSSGDSAPQPQPQPIVPFVPATFQAASVVLGQTSFTSGVVNAGGLDAGTLANPTAAVEAGGRLWVADVANNRVLAYAGVPATNGLDAVVALGQPDRFSNLPGTTATTMSQPVGLVAAGGRLYVSEFANNRVLIFDTLPNVDGAAANAVLGQGDLSSAIAGTTQARLASPVGIHYGGGRFVLADSANHRVLVWNGLPFQNGENADLVLGQADFISGTVNAGNPMAAPDASSMSSPYGVWTDGVRLVVADRGNNRVLIWTTFPTTDGQAADLVLGQADFLSAAPSSGASGLRLPSGVTGNGEQLLVADADNNRVLVWDAFPLASGQAADRILGQSTFVSVAPNDDDQDLVRGATPSARTLDGTGGFLFAGLFGTRLWVGDFRNHRVLRFDGN
ncbi:MAG: hypothetical protein P1V36_06785 [Planctomycetota bacterium]|nr:hypothetical protein [Planctomycetota bacterium]